MSWEDAKNNLVDKLLAPMATAFKDEVELDSTVLADFAKALSDWLASDNRGTGFSLNRAGLALSARISDDMLQVVLQKAVFQLEGQSPQKNELSSSFGSKGPGISVLESNGRFVRAEIPLREVLEQVKASEG